MSGTDTAIGAAVDSLTVSAYTVPTDAPEGDGTLRWSSTTIVIVEASGGGETGLGYTYANVATASVIADELTELVEGADPMAPPAIWADLVAQTRNLGRPGIVSMAIAAVDTAIWDLKARLQGVPLYVLLGPARDDVPVYGSGGFTTYSESRLVEQLSGWVERGIPRVKMKVGTDPEADPGRAAAVRAAIGPDPELFVDANGALSREGALLAADRFRDEADVSWFEEPVSSDDLAGLRLLRDRAPAGMAIAAGEYGYDVTYFARMVTAGAVDVLQADVTRCAGITELLRVDGLCRAHQLPLSLHCGPAIHVHPGMALDSLVHLEYFHDHTRIEKILFEGLAELRDGALRPDSDRPGNGLALKSSDADRYAV
jgi:L-alanine-DL-glutamate epimerase-like enolase superfamily enzyme